MARKIIGLLIGLALMVGGILGVNYSTGSVNMTGNIYAMNTTLVSPYKSTRIIDAYRVAIHPDDKERFNDMDIEVSFADYCNHNVGDRVTYKVSRFYDKTFHYGLAMSGSILILIAGIFVLVSYAVFICADLLEE